MKKSYFILLLGIASSIFSCKKNHDTNPTPKPVPVTPSAADLAIAIDKAGNIYVADLTNNKIRKISPL